ncbi:carboxylesterase/lipase family protein [Kibdelosporangium aridum]|uniref:Carboxylic ester hydrolase n=1 Tax=Kibdelosporangium aridum TaxID=2030 RepID=A0A428Z5Y5_KIBAR|nr:carboxylesterase family protein [Kibdelosporangium aridum]RSM82474.1 carboxylesterase/lipase family protein [Kibdelosporangium aridum]
MALVTIEQGRLSGLQGEGCVVWRGIPYAEPPVGDLRWRAPRRAPRWGGTWRATDFGPQALQPQEIGVAAAPSSEDCLYLNVCAPEGTPPPGGWPVLFWLHGGGYRTGSGIQAGEGEAFARAGIVVVTVNYRLGALGMTYLAGIFGPGEPDAGVCALLDQVAALRWVRANIGAFGGNPQRITVYGVSAGAKSVGNLMASPMSRNLFSQAIISSGGDHVATPEQGTRVARRLIDELGTKDLRSVPAEDILAAQERILTGMASVWLWRPTIHPTALPATPTSLIAAGSAAGIRLMIGHNGNEAATFSAFLGDEAIAPVDDVLTEIFGNTKILDTYRDTRGADAAKIAVMSDERYGIPTQRLADAQAPHSRVYRYRIDIAQPGVPHFLDGAHGMELGMVWNPPAQASLPREITAAQIHEAWVNFIEDGIPLPSWPPYGETRPVLVFDEDPHVEFDPNRRERLAWGDVSWQPGAWFPF